MPGERIRGARIGDWLVVTIVGLAAAWFYFWTATSNDPLPRMPGPQSDYYNLLVRSLRAGHLYMDATPDPALVAMVPDKRPGNAPYLLDASLYGQHYYLYFGITPALTFFLPYALFTGRELPCEWAVAAQATLGCWIGLALLIWAWPEFFPRAGRLSFVVAALTWAFATAVPVTLRKAEVYEAACTAGFLWSVAMFYCTARAVVGEHRRALWLAAASLSLGLAVGSRPNLLVGAGALGGATFWLLWRAGADEPRRWRWLLAAIVPAAMCGGALACYNYARFGDPLEFGHRFQVGSIADNYFSLRYFVHNLRVYYLTPPSLSWFFPFFSPGHEGARPLHYMGIEYANGQWVFLPWLMMVIGIGVVFFRRAVRAERLAVIAGVLGFWFIANLALVGSLSARANRYMLDFHPALVLLACLALLAGGGRGGAWRTGVVAGSLVLLTAVVFNLAISFQVHEFFRQKNPGAYATIERMANRVLWPVYRLTAPQFGAIALEIAFADTPVGRREPLLSTGAPLLTNTLTMVTGAPGRAWLEFDQEGEGGPRGPEFSFIPGRASSLKIWLGSLLPPAGHPWFAGLQGAEEQRQKQSVVVELNEKVIFCASAVPHDASPGQVRLGTRVQHYSEDHAHFSGRFSNVRRLMELPPVPSPSAPEEPLAYAVKLLWPRDRFGLIDPVLATGETGRGDLLVVHYASPTTVRFGHDSIGGGIEWSEPLAVDYAVPQEIQVAFDDGGAADPLGPRAREGLRSTIRIGGREVWREKNAHHPFVGEQVAVGCNTIGASCRRYFGGAILDWKFVDDGVRREAAAPDGRRTTRTVVELPSELSATRAQPLLAYRNAAGTRGVLAVRGAGANALQLGWIEAEKAVWSDKFAASLSERATLQVCWAEGRTESVAANAGVSADVFMRDRLSVIWEGMPVFQPRQTFFLSPAVAVVGGHSAWPASEALSARFAGRLLSGDAGEIRSSVAWRTGVPRQARLIVRFPAGRAGVCEPLLTAGHTGAADSVFVRYVAEGKIRLGFDHWGVGGPESGLLEVDFSQPHELELRLGEGSWESGGEGPLRVRLDGQTAIDARVVFHPAPAGEILFGENPVGLSTSVPEFSGVLISLEGR